MLSAMQAELYAVNTFFFFWITHVFTLNGKVWNNYESIYNCSANVNRGKKIDEKLVCILTYLSFSFFPFQMQMIYVVMLKWSVLKPANLSTQLYWEKVHYSKLFNTVYVVAI